MKINPSAELFGATDVLYMSILSSGKKLFNKNFSMQNSGLSYNKNQYNLVHFQHIMENFTSSKFGAVIG